LRPKALRNHQKPKPNPCKTGQKTPVAHTNG
jgi:hypothetical protein